MTSRKIDSSTSPSENMLMTNEIDNASLEAILRRVDSSINEDQSNISFNLLEPTPIRPSDQQSENYQQMLENSNNCFESNESFHGVDASLMASPGAMHEQNQEDHVTMHDQHQEDHISLQSRYLQMAEDRLQSAIHKNIPISSSFDFAGHNVCKDMMTENLATNIAQQPWEGYIPKTSPYQTPTDLETYGIMMEKLCQTMKRSAMSRTLIKQISGGSLTTQHSERPLLKQGSGRNLKKQSSGRNIGAQSRQSSNRSLTYESDSSGGTVPTKKSTKDMKHRLRPNSHKSLNSNQIASIDVDQTSIRFLTGDEHSDNLKEK